MYESRERMGKNLDRYRGCLLGLAVGDAMGMPVDDMTLEQIRENYGPNGLLGYELFPKTDTASAVRAIMAD